MAIISGFAHNLMLYGSIFIICVGFDEPIGCGIFGGLYDSGGGAVDRHSFVQFCESITDENGPVGAYSGAQYGRLLYFTSEDWN